jgi:putative membrane protein
VLLHWLVLTLALLIVSHFYSGLSVASLPSAIVGAAVLGVLNAIVRPVLQFFALPITFVTLGLFYFVINGLMLYWTASLVRGFAVRSFGAAILGSIMISLVSLLLNFLLSTKKPKN